ncbi:MAG: DUF5110 domain-containing protein, partial [Bacteroidales bacterium]|nr:DUF5110 domain-containing protein [Bacteroidales bacterium]
GQMVTRKFLLSEYPLYVKAGSVIPMYGNDVNNLEHPVKNLVIGVFPGKNDSGFSLYEDSGNDEGYKKGEYGITRINKTITDDGVVKVEIMPRKGTYPGMLDKRNLEIRFYGAYMPAKVSVNGKAVPFDSTGGSGNKACWKYSGGTLTAHVYLPDVSCGDKADVVVKFVSADADINGVPGKMTRLKKSTSYLKNHWNKWDALPAVISLTDQTDILIHYHPEEFNDLINSFNKNYLLIPDTIKTTPASKTTIDKCINLIK